MEKLKKVRKRTEPGRIQTHNIQLDAELQPAPELIEMKYFTLTTSPKYYKLKISRTFLSLLENDQLKSTTLKNNKLLQVRQSKMSLFRRYKIIQNVQLFQRMFKNVQSVPHSKSLTRGCIVWWQNPWYITFFTWKKNITQQQTKVIFQWDYKMFCQKVRVSRGDFFTKIVSWIGWIVFWWC